MKTIRRHLPFMTVFVIFLGISFGLLAVATVDTVSTPEPKLSVASLALPKISATAALVVDSETKTVLYEQQADDILPIASVTKLFSSALYWSGVDPFATTTITTSDLKADGRSGRLQARQMYQNRELLFPALLESSNDASVVMERVAPFDLVATMNDYTKKHGATQTIFTDPSGLSDGNVSTARELATLFIALVDEYPHIIDITRLPQYFNHVNAWLNNSPFIDTPGYAGGKQGFTKAANRTAIVRFMEPIGGRERAVVYVLLGSDNLKSDIDILRQFVNSAARFE